MIFFYIFYSTNYIKYMNIIINILMFNFGQNRKANTDFELYERLGLNKNANEKQIKIAYKNKVKTCHPDKGGSKEEFQKIYEAYDILSNQEKKELYDKYGMDGINNNDTNMPDISDVFSWLFENNIFGWFGNNFNGFWRNSGQSAADSERRERQNENEELKEKIKIIEKTICITLEEAYNGLSLPIEIDVNIVCDKCSGNGGSNISICDECNGKGIINKIVCCGPMISQTTSDCKKCNKKGKIIKNICNSCNGNKIIKKKKQIDVVIKKGIWNNEILYIHSKGNEYPRCKTGDIKFIILIKNHLFFTRINNDLMYNKEIDVLELLTGCIFSIEFLNNKKINIKIDDVIDINKKYEIDGYGMNNNAKLFIKFILKFNKQINEEEKKVICDIFGPKKNIELTTFVIPKKVD